jgi:hypothetical protein
VDNSLSLNELDERQLTAIEILEFCHQPFVPVDHDQQQQHHCCNFVAKLEFVLEEFCKVINES